MTDDDMDGATSLGVGPDAGPDAYRHGWAAVQDDWDATIERARELAERAGPDVLHESVAGEWSFTETLRHLSYATAAWVLRGVRAETAPWHPLDLPWDQAPEMPGVPRDRSARPGLDEVLTLRRTRTDVVRDLVESLTEADLASEVVPGGGTPGWPRPVPHAFAECVRIVLNEEVLHRRYAERDLAVLAARTEG